MNTDTNLKRRQFLKTTAAASTYAASGLVIGFHLPANAKAAASNAKIVQPNAWVKIGTDNSVTIICHRSEMGQGQLFDGD